MNPNINPAQTESNHITPNQIKSIQIKNNANQITPTSCQAKSSQVNSKENSINTNMK